MMIPKAFQSKILHLSRITGVCEEAKGSQSPCVEAPEVQKRP